MARTGTNSRITALGQYPQTSAPTFGTDLTEVVDDVAELIGEEAATVTALPTTSLFVGRTVWVVAVNGFYVCRSLSPTVWVPASSQFAAVNIGDTTTSGNTRTAATTDGAESTDSSTVSVGTNAFVVARSGMYKMEVSVNWQTSSLGRRQLEFQRNAASFTVPLGDQRPASEQSLTTISGKRRLTAGDEIRLRVTQTSGDALTYSGQMSVEWVHV